MPISSKDHRNTLAIAIGGGLFFLLALLIFFYQPYTAAITPFLFSIGLYYFLRRHLNLKLNNRLQLLDEIISSFPFTSQTPHDLANDKHPNIDDIIEKSVFLEKSISSELNRLNQTESFRKEFIGDISHELKTPIFSIQGYLETLAGGALEDKKVNYVFLHKALKNVERLIVLTNDLMEISKLETGELKPDLQVIPINTIIKDVIESLQYKANKLDVTISFESDQQNYFAWADRNQMRQVLINLIENGIKYNVRNGRVVVSTTHDHSQGLIHINVIDTGIGIPKDDIPRITDRFFRVDKSRSRDQGGTGLGLSIVKHILERHGHKLLVKSTPGKGSNFYFSLTSADQKKEQVSRSF